jgi:NADH-quinone oxidoreductase subunit N
LCAIPQRNLKRLLGYSSIAHAGYLMLGIAAVTGAGAGAVLFYLGGYLFTVLAAFSVIAVVFRELETEDIGDLAGLGRRAPFLAATLALAMVSLAGIPPLVGFVGKFVLLKAVLERGATEGAYYWLVAAALAGMLISLYYYLGVVRAIYWSKEPAELPAVPTSRPLQWALGICVAAMLLLGVAPGVLINLAAHAAAALRF